MLELIQKPWPWYVAGPLIGLMVPLLLILGNKRFGISSSFRHICAACLPANIPFFRYDWKRESWNLFFVGGVLIGGIICGTILHDPSPVVVDAKLAAEWQQYGITNLTNLVPAELFNWNNVFTLRGLLFMVVGGFLIGFGTRYAGGCTSGHSITGMSMLQFPSLVATCCFMIGGVIVANFILPWLLSL